MSAYPATRRQLADTLIDLANGVDFAAPGAGLRVTSIEMILPLELSLASGPAAGTPQAQGMPQVAGAAEPLLLGDVPQYVYRTAFDYQPGKLTVVWAASESAGGSP